MRGHKVMIFGVLALALLTFGFASSTSAQLSLSLGLDKTSYDAAAATGSPPTIQASVGDKIFVAIKYSGAQNWSLGSVTVKIPRDGLKFTAIEGKEYVEPTEKSGFSFMPLTWKKGEAEATIDTADSVMIDFYTFGTPISGSGAIAILRVELLKEGSYDVNLIPTPGGFMADTTEIPAPPPSKATIATAPPDVEPPVLKLTISPKQVRPGGDVSITVVSNEALKADPTVVVKDAKGVAITDLTLTEKKDNTYTYKVKVPETAAVGDGSVSVEASDLAGNKGTASDKFTVVVAPIVSVKVTLPAGKTLLKDGDKVLIDVTSDKDLAKLPTVHVTQKGGVPSAVVMKGDVPGRSFSGEYVVVKGFDGAAVVEATGVDELGNVSEVAKATFDVDATPPARPAEKADVLLTIAGKDYKAAEKAVVKGTVKLESPYTVDPSGIAKVEYYYDVKDFTEPGPTTVLIASVTTAPFTADWDTTKVKDGTYYVKSFTFDVAGNVADPAVPVVVDNSSPVITITSPTAANPVRVEWTKEVEISFKYTEANPKDYTVDILDSAGTVLATKKVSVGLVGGVDVAVTEKLTLPAGVGTQDLDVRVTMTDTVGNPPGVKVEAKAIKATTDITPPYVVGTFPPKGEKQVDPEVLTVQGFQVIFSEPMDRDSVLKAKFSVSREIEGVTTAVAPPIELKMLVDAGAFSATWAPGAIPGTEVLTLKLIDMDKVVELARAAGRAIVPPLLKPNSTYTITVTGKMTDLAGNQLAKSKDDPTPIEEIKGSFETIDTIPPTATIVYVDPGTGKEIPLDGAVGVPVATKTIKVKFSETMEAGTVSAATFLVRNFTTGTTVQVVVKQLFDVGAAKWVGNDVEIDVEKLGALDPRAKLVPARVYEAMLTGTVPTDKAGNPVALTSLKGRFATEDKDLPGPTYSIAPAPGAKQVPLDAEVEIYFTRPMNRLGILDATLSVETQTTDGKTVAPPVKIKIGDIIALPPENSPVLIRWDENDTAIFVKPTGLVPLKPNRVYIVTIEKGAVDITDKAGNPIVDANGAPITKLEAKFYTIDTIPPSVVKITPADGSARVPVTTSIEIEFSEELHPAWVDASTWSLTDLSTGKPVKITVGLDPSHTKVTIKPAAPLSGNTTYQLTLDKNVITDMNGNPFVGDISVKFSTGPIGAVTPVLGPIATPTNKTSVSVSGVAAADLEVEVFVNGASAGKTTAGADGKFSLTVSLAEGTNKIVARSKDATGTSSPVSNEVVVVRDTKKPVANAGTDIKVEVGTPITLSGAGSTDEVGIATYSWDLGDGTTASGATVTKVYNKVGKYTVTLTVTDTAGNVSDPAKITVEVVEKPAPPDQVPPVLAITAPRDGALVYVDKVKLVGTATDNVTAAVDVEISVNGAVVKAKGPEIKQDVTLKEGENVIVVTAKDGAGNIAKAVLRVTYEKPVTPLYKVMVSKNPFVAEEGIAIRYVLQAAGTATIKVYNKNGELVRTIADGKAAVAGENVDFWDGKDDAGNIVPAGIYIIQIKAADKTITKAIGVLKRK